MKHLAPNLPLVHAVSAAMTGASMAFAVHQLAIYCESADELEALPNAFLVACQSADGKPQIDLLGRSQFPGLDALPEGGIDEWMKKNETAVVTVLDLNAITLKLSAGVQIVRDRRLAR